MKSLKDVSVGDAVKLVGPGYQRRSLVKRATQTLIVVESGYRFRRKDGTAMPDSTVINIDHRIEPWTESDQDKYNEDQRLKSISLLMYRAANTDPKNVTDKKLEFFKCFLESRGDTRHMQATK